MHSLCIAVQLVRLSKELIPAAKSMVMIIVDKIEHSVEDYAKLGRIPAIAGYHVCVSTRVCQLLQQNAQALHPIKYCSLNACNFFRNS